MKKELSRKKETKNLETLEKELTKVIKERDEYLAGWQRAKADLENYRKRKNVEMDEFKKYAQVEFILRILPILDNFEKAYAHLPKEMEKDPWIQGIAMIKIQLEEILKSFNIKEIKAEGEEFNPALHEALQKTSSSQKIKKVIEKGYTLNEKIIRPAKVIL
jgi:molecular chaperone GrpE